MMRIIFRIAVRNLVRQKRRNILLGTGIAFGIMALFISQSYTKGLSDVLINSVIANLYGHIQVSVTEKSQKSIPIIRDKNSVIDTIKRTVDNVNSCKESISTLTRAVGNDNGSLMMIVGIEKNNKDFFNSLKITGGNIGNFINGKTYPPILVFTPKANELGVKAGDLINVKMKTIYGQVQSALFQVAAIAEPDNIFINFAGFVPLEILKGLLGYRPYETAKINIRLNHIGTPEETVKTANLLYRAFEPKPLIFRVNLISSVGKGDALAMGLDNNANISDLMKSMFNVSSNTVSSFLTAPNAVIIGSDVAKTLGVKVNDRIRVGYESKYEGGIFPETQFEICHILDEKQHLYSGSIFFNALEFRRFYSEYLPLQILDNDDNAFMEMKKQTLFMAAVVKDKILLERPKNSEEWKELQQYIEKYRGAGDLMLITSMNETAEDIMKIESALNLISIFFVGILFAIILTGLVNSLRMSIKERTREIGTVRSIGMSKKYVVGIFVAESAMLSLFSSAVGVAAAYVIMSILSKITINVDNLFSILIDNGHLRFLPDFEILLIDILIILIITMFTSWLPSKKAAAKPITASLTHHE